jgi:hypothetical protein
MSGQDARGGVPLHVAQHPLDGLLQVVGRDCDDDACSRTLEAECPQYTWPNLLRGYCR